LLPPASHGLISGVGECERRGAEREENVTFPQMSNVESLPG